jgi:hypothetical protein
MKWLEQCDFLLAEVSGSSFGLGFEAGYLLGGRDGGGVFKQNRADHIQGVNFAYNTLD